MTDASQTQQERISERKKQGTADNANPLKNELIAVAACSDPLERLAYQICWAQLELQGLEQIAKTMQEELEAALNSDDPTFSVSEYDMDELRQEITKIEHEISILTTAKEGIAQRGNLNGHLASWMSTKTGNAEITQGEEMMKVIRDFASPSTFQFKRVAPLRKAVPKSDQGISYTAVDEPYNITTLKPAGFGALLSYQYYTAQNKLQSLDEEIQGIQRRIDYGQTTPGPGNPPPPGWEPNDATESLSKERDLRQHERDRLQKFQEAIKKEERFRDFDREHRDKMREYTGAATVGEIMVEQVFSLALNFVPGVGEVVNLQQFITGVDLITGDELGQGSRLLALICALPLIGSLSKMAKEVKAMEVTDKALVLAADGTTLVSKTREETDPIRKIMAAPGGDESALRAYLTDENVTKIMNVERETEKPVNIIKVVADEKAAGVWIAQDGGALLLRLEKETGQASKIVNPTEMALEEAVKLAKKQAQVKPNLKGFERALQEAYGLLTPEMQREIKGFEISGKTAGLLFEGGGTLRDIDIMILSDDQAAIMELFNKTELQYQQLTGSRFSLFENEITVWKGWRQTCDPKAMKRVDEVGGKVKATYEAVESKALVRFLTNDIGKVEYVEKITLDNSTLLRSEKLTLRNVWEAADEALAKIKKIRLPGGLHGEDESKYVSKLYRLLKEAEKEHLIPSISEDYEKIAEKASMQQMAKFVDGRTFVKVTEDMRLTAKEVDRFVSHWSNLGKSSLRINFEVLCRFMYRLHAEGKNAVREILEMGIDPKYLIPIEKTARLSSIATALRHAQDFTEWWDELTDDDIDDIIESMSLAQEDTEFLKAFSSYIAGESETEKEYNFNTPFRPMVTH